MAGSFDKANFSAVRCFTIFACLTLPQMCYPQAFAPGMEPESAYREYTVNPSMSAQQWRVTDPDSIFEERAAEFLPNPVLEISGVRLEGATRAELTIDFWSGHEGTVDKKVRFNDGRKWIPLMEHLNGTENEANNYLAEYNLTLPVPLADLVEGTNRIRGTSGDNPWGWGQWGWYALTLRIYTNPASTEPMNLKVVQLQTGNGWNMPQFRIIGDTDNVNSVDYLAAYEGVDEDGDGAYRDYHGMYRFGAWVGHVGSSNDPAASIVWDTEWIPDQHRPVSIMARVRDNNGVWHVLQPLENVSMNTRDFQVKIIHPRNRPTKFWVRDGRINSCVMELPLDFDPVSILDARMFLRTWNPENNEQRHTPFRINHGEWQKNITGPGHQFHMEAYSIPFNDLRAGHNLFTFHSTTRHHGCELLWPGPQMLLKIKQEIQSEN